LQTGKSTENNADIFGAFTDLAAVETSLGNAGAAASWTAAANVAGDFVMAMYDSSAGRFYAGTVPADMNPGPGPGFDPTGPQKGNDIINKFDFLDSDSFATLALASSPRYRTRIDWHTPVQYILSNFAQTITAGGKTYQGFDLVTQPTATPGDNRPTPGPNGIAWEFTAQAVEAMQYVDLLYGDSTFAAPAAFYFGQIANAQAMAPFGDGDGLVAATVQDGDTLPPPNQGLTTPFQFIPERVSLAPTDWAIFADQNFSPFPSSATHFVVAAPVGATAGIPINVTVTALTPFGKTDPTYMGTVHFTSTDRLATLPADYTFTAGPGMDNGVHTFSSGIVLRTAGTQTVTATDTATSPTTGSAAVVVMRQGTNTDLTTSPNPFTFGGTLLLTATLHLASRTGTPTGTVTFLDGATVLGSASLNGQGQAVLMLPLTPLAPGTHAFTASYSGDQTFAPSSGTSPPQIIVDQPVQDATAQVAIALGGIRHHGGLLEQTVALTDIFTGSLLEAPISFVLRGLSPQITVVNRTGRLIAHRPRHAPYVDAVPGGSFLSPGQMVSFVVLFKVPSGGAVHYKPLVLAGVGVR
jgi:hypothetical protein